MCRSVSIKIRIQKQILMSYWEKAAAQILQRQTFRKHEHVIQDFLFDVNLTWNK